MKLNKEKLLARDGFALREFERVCRDCARIGASRVGAIDFLDDITQEIMLLVLTKTIHIYDPEREIEPFLITAAKFIGQAMRRRHGREVLMGDAGDEAHSESWINTIADPEHEDAGDRIDRQHAELQAEAAALVASAGAEMALLMNAHDAQKPEPEPAPNPAKASRQNARTKQSPVRTRKLAGVPKLAVPKRQRCGEAEALRLIRLKSRLTHEWMAKALGLPTSKLHAIEYGLCPPPEGLVTKAETVAEQAAREAPALQAASIADIVTGWYTRLGLAPDDYAGFALAIGIDRSTAFRWLRNIYKPNPDRLWSTEYKVQAVEKERSELLAKVPRPS